MNHHVALIPGDSVYAIAATGWVAWIAHALYQWAPPWSVLPALLLGLAAYHRARNDHRKTEAELARGDELHRLEVKRRHLEIERLAPR